MKVRARIQHLVFTFSLSALLLTACDAPEYVGSSATIASVAPSSTPIHTPTPTATPAPTATPTPTATPAPTATPSRTAISCTLKTSGGLCDRIIDLGSSTYTRYDASVVPAGGLLCLKAGSFPNGRLIIENLTGSSTNYSQIKNCGGQFNLGNQTDSNNDGIVDSSAGLEIDNSKYFLFSGTGSTETYGINLLGTSSGQSSFIISELSTDYEVEYTEVQHSGFSGIMAKTDPVCTDTSSTSFRGGFVQRNVSFHNNYIHDTQGEGFYIGFSFSDGIDKTCNGSTVHVYSHPVDGVKVYNNILERTGCEAIQFGLSKNSDVHHNFINGFGRSPFSNYQNNGIQIGEKSGGKVYQNFILNPDPSFQVGSGIIIIGSEANLVYSNTIVNAGDGMYIHNLASSGKTLDIVNNTIVNPIGDSSTSHQGSGIWNANSIATIRIINNLVVMGPVRDSSLTVSQIPTGFGIYDQTVGQNAQRAGQYATNITATTNLFLNPVNATGLFSNASTYDYRVLTNNALNSGTSVSSLGVTSAMSVSTSAKSVSTVSRTLGAIDIGAFESQ